MHLSRLAVVIVFTCLLGCADTGGGQVSRLNEFSFANHSGEPLYKVIVEWNDKSFTIDNKHGGLEKHSSHVRKLPVSKPMNAQFRITAYFAEKENDTATHEMTVALDPQERKLIEVSLQEGRRFAVREQQRNPHIQ